MKRFPLGLALAVALMHSAAGWAMDAVKTTTAEKPLSGQITAMTPLQVTLEQTTGSKEIPVNEIVSITYQDEPSIPPNTLKGVRNLVAARSYEEALKMLQKLHYDDVGRREVHEDLEYYRALCKARLALDGEGTIPEAGSLMIAFVTNHANSYHYLPACEVIGDLLMATHSYAKAEGYYRKMAAAPWPISQMRARVAIGRALLAQKNAVEAMNSFQQVLAAEVKGEQAEFQHTAAMIGKARCLAETGKAEEAIQLAQEIIDKTSSEEVDLQAHAYNALGVALRKTQRTKEAIFAFLHVDLLYDSVPAAHAEALANLAELWESVKQPDRAMRARQTLLEKYGG